MILNFISMFSFFLSRPTRLQDSDGEKSDQDLVVDIANETVSSIELVKNPKKENFFTTKHAQ